MSEDQVLASEILNGKGDVYLTGPAGSGKSFLLNNWAMSLPPRQRPWRAASTGAAARLIGGKTVNSIFRISPDVHVPGSILEEPLDPNMAWYWKLLANASSIVFDEVSMIRVDTFQAILERMKQIKPYRNLPGRPRLIFVGDFAQLPPIVTAEEEAIMRHHYGGRVFCFEHKFWDSIKVASLSTIHRQRDDLTFSTWLNEIREGGIPDLSWINNFVREPREGAVNLVSRREAAREINQTEMDKLETQPFTFEGGSNGREDNELPVPAKLTLKVGCRVIICANQKGVNKDGEKDYVNGSTGTFMGAERGRDGRVSARVMIDDTGESVLVETHKWNTMSYAAETNLAGDVIGYSRSVSSAYEQIPLLPGYAITIHRSQGMSLPRANVDVNGSFAPGQVYVALSRLTSTDGLSLSRPVKFGNIIHSEKVRQYNRSIFKSQVDEPELESTPALA